MPVAAFIALAAGGVCFVANSARAEEGGALQRFAAAMARLDFAAAYDGLCAADREALPRAAFVERYRRLTRAPFMAAVLRSARVEEGQLTAIDWSEARLLRAGLAQLQNGELSHYTSMRRRTYDTTSVAGGVSLALGRRMRTEASITAAAAETEIKAGRADADWFGRYAALRVRCPRQVGFIVARVKGQGVDVEVGVPCGGREFDDLLLDVEVDSRAWKGQTLSAQVLLVAPKMGLDPFAAPSPELVLHPAAPLH